MISYDFSQKSSVAAIRATFDQAVERFSNLETGHQAAMDSRVIMELIAAAAAHTTPHATSVLDIGCGAGNYTLKLLESLPGLDCTLIDLSRPMLDRAKIRVSAKTTGNVVILQGDIREIELFEERFDIVITGSTLHHLRGNHEWERVFTKVFRSLKPGGTFWISDLVSHDDPSIHALMWDRYGQYLVDQEGESFRDRIFKNIAEEDTPRSIGYQMDLLRKVGFVNVDILHKNACFAAFGGSKFE